MSTSDAPAPTVADVLDEEDLEQLAAIEGLREARRALRNRGGGRR